MAFFTAESRRHKSAYQFLREFNANDTRSERQNIHVVVLDALVRRIGVVAQSGADAGQFVGSYRCAHPAAADQDATLGAPVQQLESKFFRVIWIIDGLCVVRAEVNQLVL